MVDRTRRTLCTLGSLEGGGGLDVGGGAVAAEAGEGGDLEGGGRADAREVHAAWVSARVSVVGGKERRGTYEEPQPLAEAALWMQERMQGSMVGAEEVLFRAAAVAARTKVKKSVRARIACC